MISDFLGGFLPLLTLFFPIQFLHFTHFLQAHLFWYFPLFAIFFWDFCRGWFARGGFSICFGILWLFAARLMLLCLSLCGSSPSVLAGATTPLWRSPTPLLRWSPVNYIIDRKSNNLQLQSRSLTKLNMKESNKIKIQIKAFKIDSVNLCKHILFYHPIYKKASMKKKVEKSWIIQLNLSTLI